MPDIGVRGMGLFLSRGSSQLADSPRMQRCWLAGQITMPGFGFGFGFGFGCGFGFGFGFGFGSGSGSGFG